MSNENTSVVISFYFRNEYVYTLRLRVFLIMRTIQDISHGV